MKFVLLSGIEEEKGNLITTFSLECVKLYKYLFDKLSIPKEKIYFFSPEEFMRLKIGGILRDLKIMIKQDPYEPLVIYFNGHGRINEWCFYTKDGCAYLPFVLCHKKLIRALRKQRGPLIIIADCCFSMSLMESLKNLKCEKLLIGLSPKNRVGFDSVLDQVLEKWNSGNIANPLYNNGKRKIRFIKRTDYRKSKYCRLFGGDKKFHRYYYNYFVKKTRIVLRNGNFLDHYMYPKK